MQLQQPYKLQIAHFLFRCRCIYTYEYLMYIHYVCRMCCINFGNISHCNRFEHVPPLKFPSCDLVSAHPAQPGNDRVRLNVFLITIFFPCGCLASAFTSRPPSVRFPMGEWEMGEWDMGKWKIGKQEISARPVQHGDGHVLQKNRKSGNSMKIDEHLANI